MPPASKARQRRTASAPTLPTVLEQGRVAATRMTTWQEWVAPRYVRLMFAANPSTGRANLRHRIAAAV